MFPTSNTANKDDSIRSIKSSSQNLKDDARDTAEGAANDIREAAHNAGRKVRRFISNASEEISGATDTVTTQIRNKPVQSSLVALGVGFVLGSLFRR